jgi:hypothetical protein
LNSSNNKRTNLTNIRNRLTIIDHSYCQRYTSSHKSHNIFSQHSLQKWIFLLKPILNRLFITRLSVLFYHILTMFKAISLRIVLKYYIRIHSQRHQIQSNRMQITWRQVFNMTIQIRQIVLMSQINGRLINSIHSKELK